MLLKDLGNLAALRTFRVLRALKTVAVVPGEFPVVYHPKYQLILLSVGQYLKHRSCWNADVRQEFLYTTHRQDFLLFKGWNLECWHLFWHFRNEAITYYKYCTQFIVLPPDCYINDHWYTNATFFSYAIYIMAGIWKLQSHWQWNSRPGSCSHFFGSRHCFSKPFLTCQKIFAGMPRWTKTSESNRKILKFLGTILEKKQMLLGIANILQLLPHLMPQSVLFLCTI